MMQFQQSRIDCKNEGLHGSRGGGGAKAYCNVNRMRRAYYFYYIPYVGALVAISRTVALTK